MRTMGLVIAFALMAGMGCEITDYPVITDARGADGGSVLRSFYDQAYIIPPFTVATVWDDGSDELYTLVTQDWKGDQWLYTYNNFDPTSQINFLDQTYCDPVRQSNCANVVAWNPDLPNDDPLDYDFYPDCSGARSACTLLAFDSRLGECGSGLWTDRQAAALEFSRLGRISFRGRDYYHLPVDAGVAGFALRSDADGATGVMPVFGRFNGYIDDRLRLVLPVTPNAKHQLRWLKSWVETHGDRVRIDATYGSLTAGFHVRLTNLEHALDRM